VDRTSPPDRHIPAGQPVVTWGLGDFFWIYFGGIFAGVVLATIGYGISGDRPAHPGAITDGLSFLGQFGGWLIGLVLVSRRKGMGSLRADFGLIVHRREFWYIAVGVGLEIALAVLIYPIVHLVNQSQDVVKDLDQARGVHLVLIALVAGLIAPVCEELLFRGLLLRALRRRVSPEAAVTISALAFALAHPMLSPTWGTFAVVPALFALGAVSGVMAVRRGDLSVSIMLHIGFNLLTTVGAFHH
jgi:membrane protease YdiL (CAAX protease family)